jgi:hypothetical protein
MKEASECLKIAQRCDVLASEANEVTSTRVLRAVANQWRKLADDSERHKRLTWTQRPEHGKP